MLVTPLRTDVITPGSHTLEGVLDTAIAELLEGSIVAVSSKIISLCENRVVPLESTDRDTLIEQESDIYLPADYSPYGHHFTIARGTLVGSAGVDVSNGAGTYVLWPANPQADANRIRTHLQQRFGLMQLGVIVTDSVSQFLRLGAVGTCLAYSGFLPVKSYVGESDLFGRKLAVERANVAEGLAAAAVLAMGEGAEQTPVCILSDLPFVSFNADDPSEDELESTTVRLQDDLFAPFFLPAPWRKGGRSTRE
ncbi:MAG TPA: coenzyme F420-0:L-glutamate ligase [Candidatus Saccharimonadales bacterium]|nr:coenzyme F420-0:L-glutamate ligase [Candidatus Saccharimonadales bacterium]